jgi:dTDP-4-dehydrorhamnose reductase
MMVLRATEDYGTPRNIYGVTKKLAEEYCKESSCSVAILRLSRFFAEDMAEMLEVVSEYPAHFLEVSTSMA